MEILLHCGYLMAICKYLGNDYCRSQLAGLRISVLFLVKLKFLSEQQKFANADPFHATNLFLYSLKISENLWLFLNRAFSTKSRYSLEECFTKYVL